MGYSPRVCKESDVTEQLSTDAPLLNILCVQAECSAGKGELTSLLVTSVTVI